MRYLILFKISYDSFDHIYYTLQHSMILFFIRYLVCCFFILSNIWFYRAPMISDILCCLFTLSTIWRYRAPMIPFHQISYVASSLYQTYHRAWTITFHQISDTFQNIIWYISSDILCCFFTLSNIWCYKAPMISNINMLLLYFIKYLMIQRALPQPHSIGRQSAVCVCQNRSSYT